MASRKSGEKLSDLIERFLSPKRDEKSSPDVKQRLAMGYSEAREQAKRERKKS